MSEHDASRHEATDVTIRPLLVGAVLIAVTIVLLVLLANALFPQRSLDRLMVTPFPVASLPRLQSDPPADMARFHASQMQRLDGFGWVDHGQGITHVPIAQAMRRVARDGIPGWPGGEEPGR